MPKNDRNSYSSFVLCHSFVIRHSSFVIFMKFINLTRRTEIGANSYYLETAGQRLVLDSGMHPKEEGEESLPNLRALGDRPLDAIILSHAHFVPELAKHSHSRGLTRRLIERGFSDDEIEAILFRNWMRVFEQWLEE